MNPVQKALRVAKVDGAIYAATGYYAVKSVAKATIQPVGGFHSVAVQWAQYLLKAADVAAIARGAEGVDWSKPTVIMSNHASLYDIPILFSVIPTEVNFLSKKELRAVPLMGWAMDRAGFVFIDRKDPVRSKQSIEQAAGQVKGGKAVIIFPEGTRSTDGRLMPFKKGGFVLAVKSKAQIVPVWVDGSHALLQKGTWTVYPGYAEVRVGQPVDASDVDLEGKDGLMQQVRDEMERMSSMAPLQPTGPRA